MMPGEAYEHAARAIFSYMGDALMALLAEDAITAYNMYALFRLSDDIASIQTLADSLTLPNLRVSLWESIAVMAAKLISIQTRAGGLRRMPCLRAAHAASSALVWCRQWSDAADCLMVARLWGILWERAQVLRMPC